MLQAVSAIDRLLHIIAYRTECELAEFLYLYPELTWKQVFAGVNYLSQSRRIRLKAKGASIYTSQEGTDRLFNRGRRLWNPERVDPRCLAPH